MSWEAHRVKFANDPDVGSLSKMKTLLYRHLEHSSNPQLIGRLYLNQSQIYQKIRNYPLAYEALDKAMDCFTDVKDSINLSVVYYYQGILLVEEKKYPNARDRFAKALSLISEDRDEEILLRCETHYQLGICLWETGQLEEAKIHLEESLNRAREYSYSYQEILSMQSLAQLAMKMGELETAKELFYQTLGKCRNLGDERHLGMILDHLGYLHYQSGDQYRAISAFKFSARIFEKYDVDQLPETINQLAMVYLQINLKCSEEYCKKAIDILLEELAYRFSDLKEKQLAQTFFIMGLNCKEQNDKKNMVLFFKESLRIYKKYRMEDKWNEVYLYYQKYAQGEEEMHFNETTELVKALTRNGKFNLNKIMGQIS